MSVDYTLIIDIHKYFSQTLNSLFLFTHFLYYTRMLKSVNLLIIVKTGSIRLPFCVSSVS